MVEENYDPNRQDNDGDVKRSSIWLDVRAKNNKVCLRYTHYINDTEYSIGRKYTVGQARAIKRQLEEAIEEIEGYMRVEKT